MPERTTATSLAFPPIRRKALLLIESFLALIFLITIMAGCAESSNNTSDEIWDLYEKGKCDEVIERLMKVEPVHRDFALLFNCVAISYASEENDVKREFAISILKEYERLVSAGEISDRADPGIVFISLRDYQSAIEVYKKKREHLISALQHLRNAEKKEKLTSLLCIINKLIGLCEEADKLNLGPEHIQQGLVNLQCE